MLLVRCPEFDRLVLHALLHLRLRRRYRRTMKFLNYVSSNNTKWEYEWTSIRRPVANPVTGRRTSTRRPVTAWIDMRKGVTGKEFTLTSWKTENAKCRRARTTWTQCKSRTGEAMPRAAKFGRIDNSRAQSLEWDLWIGKQSSIRYRGTKFGSFKIRDETKLLGADMESFPGIWHQCVKLTVELKSLSRHLTVQKDLGLLNSGMPNSWIEVKSFALLLQSTNQRSKLVEMTKTYRSKVNEIAE